MLASRKIAHKVVDMVCDTPGGYAFYMTLSKARQNKFKREIIEIVDEVVFNDEMLNAAFRACLNIRGMPEFKGKRLRRWLRMNVFGRSRTRMERKWYDLAKRNEDDWVI